jgi:hypothetical protein
VSETNGKDATTKQHASRGRTSTSSHHCCLRSTVSLLMGKVRRSPTVLSPTKWRMQARSLFPVFTWATAFAASSVNLTRPLPDTIDTILMLIVLVGLCWL